MALELTMILRDQVSETARKIEITIKNTTKSQRESIKKTTKSLGDYKVALLAAAAAIGTIVIAAKKIINIGKYFVNVASDAEETRNKFDAVFGDMAKSVRDWADDLSVSYGRAKADLEVWLASAQNTLKPLGLIRSDAAKLSEVIVQLSIDWASFSNAQDVDVINAFKKAILGEREALKTYDIAISEAQVKQEAYTSGIAKQGAELNQMQKALATVNILYGRTADAHGDAAKTGNSYANQMKALKGQILDVSIAIGEAILPTMAILVNFITDNMPEATTLVDQLWKSFKLAMPGVAAGIIYVKSKLQDYSENTEDAKKETDDFTKSLEDLMKIVRQIQATDTIIPELNGDTKNKVKDLEAAKELDDQLLAEEEDFWKNYEGTRAEKRGDALGDWEKEMEQKKDLKEKEFEFLKEYEDELIMQDKETAAVREQILHDSLNTMVGIFGMVAAKNKEYMGVYKAAAFAEGLISAYLAAQKTYEAMLKQTWLGPLAIPAAIAAGAASFANSMQRINAIKTVSLARGGEFVTNGPQRLIVGDNPSGREHVKVTPLNHRKRNFGSTINFVISEKLDRTYVRRTLIPMLTEEMAGSGI